MTVRGIVKKGKYYDSVTLMTVAQRILAVHGITDAAAVMGTPENRNILRNADMYVAAFDAAHDTDVLIAIAADTAEIAETVCAAIDEYFSVTQTTADSSDTRHTVPTINAACAALPGANIALVSVPGRYVNQVARTCLDNALHVLIFSDNVPVETEVSLKTYARENNLLVMGPDCGTAHINGIPLAFANALPRGPIGIVSAAGTGAQEVSTRIARKGGGISHIIGTGGRDCSKKVGGISFLHGIDLLSSDPATQVIVLISKPPDPTVMTRILDACATCAKPVVGVFLGADIETFAKKNISLTLCPTLEAVADAALTAAGLSFSDDPSLQDHPALTVAATYLQSSQRYLRGLFSGGTFCTEACLLCAEVIDSDIYSNVTLPCVTRLEDPQKSCAHSLIDMGDDTFTVGRPHPMIDYALRNARIIEEAHDPSVAVILFDVVLGYGAITHPLDAIIPALQTAQNSVVDAGRQVIFIASVTGTDADPQHRATVVKGLENTGVYVMPSNASAARLAAHITAACSA